MAWTAGRIALVAASIAGLLPLWGCPAPKDLTILGSPPDPVTIDWKATNAMGLYVTEPSASVPSGPKQHVQGMTFWALEATSFPGGFGHPVVYGHVAPDSKDTTQDDGGPSGGSALACGREYKVSVVALGGTVEAHVHWDCE